MLFSLSPVLHPMPARPVAVALYRSVAQLGRALGSGPRGQGFKPLHSDHNTEATATGCAKRTFAIAANTISNDRVEAGTG